MVDRVELERFYRTLEVQTSASVEDIRIAYRELSQVWHPDRFASSPALQVRAELRQRELNEAYNRIKEAPLGRPDAESRSDPGADWARYAQASRSRGEQGEWLRGAREAKRLNPTLDNRYQLAEALTQSGLADAAVEVCLAAIREGGSRQERFHYLLATNYVRMRAWSELRRSLARLRLSSPHLVEGLLSQIPFYRRVFLLR
ncbi:MAG TPA: DnaJ domain-containing protein [Vicinamibacteria bacterium]|nr:DnaJ domain-containing protein [Vicinamibacteria bacterium]